MFKQSLFKRESGRDFFIDHRLFIIAAWLPILFLTIWAVKTVYAYYTFDRVGGRESLQLMAEDEQFYIYASGEQLTAEEAVWLLNASHKARTQLIEYLQINDHRRQVTIRVYPYGHSHASISSHSIWLAGSGWRTSTLYHELTHVLAGGSSFAFRIEGVAVLAESRLAGSIKQPDRWWPLDAVSVAMIEMLAFPGLEELDRPGGLNVPPPSQPLTRLLFYRLAGSFTGYLVDTYGWEKYWELYQDGQYEVVYGRTLPELEQEWLAQLATYKRIRYAPLALLGLLCVALLARAVRQPAPWRRALAVGTPGFLAMAAAIVPAPFPVLAAILLGLLALLLGRQRMVERWPRGVWWTAVVVSMTLVIGLIIVPGWHVVLRYV